MFERTIKIVDAANIPITFVAYVGAALWVWNWLASQRVAMNWTIALVIAVIALGALVSVLQFVALQRAKQHLNVAPRSQESAPTNGPPISGYDLIQSTVTMAKDIEDLGIDLENWWIGVQRGGTIADWSQGELERAGTVTGKIAQLKYIAHELQDFGKRLDQWR